MRNILEWYANNFYSHAQILPCLEGFLQYAIVTMRIMIEVLRLLILWSQVIVTWKLSARSAWKMVKAHLKTWLLLFCCDTIRSFWCSDTPGRSFCYSNAWIPWDWNMAAAKICMKCFNVTWHLYMEINESFLCSIFDQRRVVFPSDTVLSKKFLSLCMYASNFEQLTKEYQN